MIRRTAMALAVAMGLTLVAASGTALAQDGGHCAAGSCSGTRAGDLIISNLASNVRHGSGAADLISDLGGNDLLTGDEGDDAVHGGSGADKVEGNAGDDFVTGGEGADKVEGNAGDDFVTGGPEEDMLQGGPGADRIEAQDSFADEVSCGAGSRDQVFADRLDSVAADCEAVVVLSKARCANYPVRGDNGPNILRGSCGKNTLRGFKGNDTLAGGKGYDICYGGRGTDGFSGCQKKGKVP